VRFATDNELSPNLRAYLERMRARPAYQRAANPGTG